MPAPRKLKVFRDEETNLHEFFGGSKRSGLQDSSSLKYGDASIFASSIPVLSIKIFPSEPFMHGSSSTGLDVKGKSAFWTYNFSSY